MTEQGFVAEIEALGARDVRVQLDRFRGAVIGVKVSTVRVGDGRPWRGAVRLPAGSPIESAFPPLLKYARKRLPL